MALSDKYRVSTNFRGHTVFVDQEPRDRVPGSDNTGWCVWEASNVLLRYVAIDDNVDALLAAGSRGSPARGTSPFDWASLRLLDLSSGAGLVAVACAAAGARVLATDIPDQLPQLERVVARAGQSGRVTCAPLWWGAPASELRPPWVAADDSGGSGGAVAGDWFDVALVSDILYIALRDGRTAELAETLRAAVAASAACLFSFEERLPDEEQAFMTALGADVDARELTGAAVAVTLETALVGAGGHADTDLWNPSLFWEAPPIRMFVLTERGRR